MKRAFLTWIICLISPNISIQVKEFLSKLMNKSEEAILDKYLSKFSEKNGQL